jgi:hypothetical protein
MSGETVKPMLDETRPSTADRSCDDASAVTRVRAGQPGDSPLHRA